MTIGLLHSPAGHKRLSLHTFLIDRFLHTTSTNYLAQIVTPLGQFIYFEIRIIYVINFVNLMLVCKYCEFDACKHMLKILALKMFLPSLQQSTHYSHSAIYH